MEKQHEQEQKQAREGLYLSILPFPDGDEEQRVLSEQKLLDEELDRVIYEQKLLDEELDKRELERWPTCCEVCVLAYSEALIVSYVIVISIQNIAIDN
jgi:hypothetical protein